MIEEKIEGSHELSSPVRLFREAKRRAAEARKPPRKIESCPASTDSIADSGPAKVKLTQDDRAPFLRPNVAEVAERAGVSTRTIINWITHGVRPARRLGKGAKSIRLAATRLPRGWCIRQEDLDAFRDQLTEAWMVPTVAETLEPPRERDRRLEKEIALAKSHGLL